MTVTVRPPTQPPAEPLITVELSYIINVSEGPDGDPTDLPTEACLGEVVCADGGPGLCGSCCGRTDDGQGRGATHPDCTHLLLPRAPLIPTVPAGTTRERELGQP